MTTDSAVSPGAGADAGAEASPVRDLLAAAVVALGGQERSGQVVMAEAVARAFGEEEHLLVQAGTGTGKSLGYLVPALLHDKRVVIATATLALQHQLVERDLPRLVKAVGRTPGVDARGSLLPRMATSSSRAAGTAAARAGTAARSPRALSLLTKSE